MFPKSLVFRIMARMPWWLGMLAACPCEGSAQTALQGTYIKVDFPGASRTYLYDINNNGQVVGDYLTAGGQIRGLLWQNESFTSIDVPDADHTYPTGINNHAQIVGFYDKNNQRLGFSRNADGGYLTLAPPQGFDAFYAADINDAGQIAGTCLQGGIHRGCLRSPGGVFTLFEIPGTPGIDPSAIGNDGSVTGNWNSGMNFHAFIRDADGNLTEIDVGEAAYHDVAGMNDAGQVVGSLLYVIGNEWYAYCLSPDGTVAIVQPFGMHASASGINDRGQIVGYYDSFPWHSWYRGFVFTPTDPPIGPATGTTKWQGDFDGDGQSDILWRNLASGQLYIWLMNGTSPVRLGCPGAVADLDWQIQGLADFNADGRIDILWRHFTTGSLFIWLMNGTEAEATASPGWVADPGWRIEFMGDFNNDGKADLLWRHRISGQLYLWLMNGTEPVSLGCPGTVSDLDWKILGIADFNGDGKSDICWRHALTGQMYLWFMDGWEVQANGCPGTVSDLDWRILGLADFNGDGRSDILWRHAATGQLAVWLMNGLQLSSLGCPGTVSDADWQILFLADFNHDGKADLLWRNAATRQLYLWLMDGLEALANGCPGEDRLSGNIQNVADYNHDGNMDLLFRNPNTGQVYIWLMSGIRIHAEGTPVTVGELSWNICR